DPPAAGLAVAAEQLLELNEQIGIRPEVAEAMIAALHRARQPLLHLRPIVAMEAVALDERGTHLVAAEYLLERPADRGSSGTRGTCHGNDWVSGGHCKPSRRSGVARRKQAPRPEQGRVELEVVVIPVIALDPLHLGAGAEHEADALVQAVGLDLQD